MVYGFSEDKSKSDLLDFFYPVGSYYETSDSTFDPNSSWGGVWTQEDEGLVHIGSGSTYTAGSTGGEKTHTLTVDEMPNHFHHTNAAYLYGNSGSNAYSFLLWGDGTAGVSGTGGDQAHNNMQPYVVVNRWHRTA